MDNDQDIDDFLSQLNLPTLTDDQNNRLLLPITKEEIHLAIKKLKKGKMAGTDGFSPEWYKIMESCLTSPLLKTFNWVMQKKMVPPSWNEALISIIPKEGKGRLECGNYRPIVVVCIHYIKKTGNHVTTFDT